MVLKEHSIAPCALADLNHLSEIKQYRSLSVQCFSPANILRIRMPINHSLGT